MQSESDLIRAKSFIPKRSATPTVIKGEAFFTADQLEELVSATEAGRRGLRVPDHGEPVRSLTRRVGEGGGRSVTYFVFRVSDCVRKRQYRTIPPKRIDLLVAIFAVSKAAKRQRDAAEKQYNQNNYGFATLAKLTKKALYLLKDCGIAEAVKQGRLRFSGTHGRLAIYTGEGYCFHSTLLPIEAHAPAHDEPPVRQETAPRKSIEPRLKDAKFTLEMLPSPEGFTSLSPPSVSTTDQRETT